MRVVPSTSPTLRTALATAVLTIALAGCTPSSGPGPSAAPGLAPSSTTSAAHTSAPKENSSAVDYSRLLIQPSDISSPGDTFVARSSVPNRRGGQGVSALFVNQDDTKAVGVTITMTPDDAAAAAALDASVKSLTSSVVGGTPQPAPVGTGGTVIRGTAPDGTKDVTLLFFTQGPAVVRMEFGSVLGQPTPMDVVTDVGTKQAIALRSGLSPR
jgi:hypothetical protein